MNKNKLLFSFREFIHAEQSGGIILILSTIVALAITNSPWGAGWQHFWHWEIGYSGVLDLKKSISHWINDGLMAVFFLLVGLEIKKEVVEGELSSFAKSALPVFAALGGMVVPALLYASVNLGQPSLGGWGIPMATDIAFALGVLALLGKRVPFSLKVMLTALAIVDDFGAIIVIAVFYSQSVAVDYILYALGIWILLMFLNRVGVTFLGIYLLLGVVLWYFTLKSGIHATISGVLLAIALPLGKGSEDASAEKLQHILEKPVAFLIMPLFALANTSFILESSMSAIIQSPISIGIILGLFVGKPLGIFLFSWVAIKSGLATLPTSATWRHLLGIGFLGGIGFTMSIFISLLAFNIETMQIFSKVAILMASVLAGITGYVILSSAAPNINSLTKVK